MKKKIIICLIGFLIFLGNVSTCSAKSVPDIITYKDKSLTLSVGQKKNLVVFGSERRNKKKKISPKKITWKSSNKAKAAVNKKGTITAKKAGKVKIYATYKGKKRGKRIRCSIKITVKSKDSTKKTAKSSSSTIGPSSTPKQPGDTTDNSTQDSNTASTPSSQESSVPSVPDLTPPPIEGDVVYSGSYKQTTWTIDKAGCLTVQGLGEIAAQGYKMGWEEHCNEIKSAVIHLKKTTSLANMFSGCANLTSVDFSDLDFSTVTNMNSMFANSGITNIDFRMSKVQNVQDVTKLFQKCKNLESVFMGSFLSITTLQCTFQECTRLTTIDISQMDLSHVITMKDTFSLCTALKSIDLSGIDTSSLTSVFQIFWGCTSLESVDVSGWKNPNLENMEEAFYRCSCLKNINLQGFKTGKVLHMSGLFEKCENLTALDISGFDTSSVLDFSKIFSGCSLLEDVDVTGFDTSNASDFDGMFMGCYSLKKLDVSNFHTEKATNMSSMFEGCSTIDVLNVSGFQTKNVLFFDRMFRGCSSVDQLDVSGFDTANAFGMEQMFSHCGKVKVLDVSRFNTSHVIRMYMMFSGCAMLEQLDLSHFDTRNNADFQMVSGCDKLTYLDLSNFDITASSSLIIYIFQQDSITSFRTPKITGNRTLLLEGIWEDEQGTQYTKIGPQMNGSILLTRVSN